MRREVTVIIIMGKPHFSCTSGPCNVWISTDGHACLTWDMMMIHFALAGLAVDLCENDTLCVAEQDNLDKLYSLCKYV